MKTRLVKSIVGGLLVLGAGIGVVAWNWQWWTADRDKAHIAFYPKNGDTPLKADGTRICSDPRFPVAVGYVNNSSRTVKSVTFEIKAYLPDHLVNILPYRTVEIGDFTKPAGSASGCYRIDPRAEYKGTDISKIEYDATILSIEFRDRRLEGLPESATIP